jgi:autotransporter-associated beta strand protein
VPDGPDAVATFAVWNQTRVTLDYFTEVSSVVFQPNASSFALTGTDGSQFSFTGAGISNQSGQVQNFHAYWNVDDEGQNAFEFFNSASAGELTEFTLDGVGGPGTNGGQLDFWDSSTAGSALINNLGDGGSSNYAFGATYFEDNSSAENATIVNTHGRVTFEDNSSAGHAMIINEAAVSKTANGGVASFTGTATTADSTIICNGDTVGSDAPAALVFYGSFGGSVTRGRARVILHGNGQMSVSANPGYTLKVTVGSIEGDGDVFLGDPELDSLAIGTNNRSTIFSGRIQDSPDASGGSFSKVGRGTLTLTGANTYTGGTTVAGGQFKISNATGSGTGTGGVLVKSGTLSGKGTIAGAVTVGGPSGGGGGPVLAPSLGSPKPVTLTIQSTLAFAKNGTYSYRVDSGRAGGDRVVANGVAIDPAAQFTARDVQTATFPPGTVLVAIQNTGVTPIAGAFGNLADGGTITIGNNTFQADYQGGDGNDLTLTLLP